MADTLINTGSETTSDNRISEVVVEAVADAEGVSPVELRPPLFEAVDPDALDTLFPPPSLERGGPEGYVAFEYCGYEVTVHADGTVSVTDQQ